MNDRQQDSLDRLIASLPKDVVPPGNLWPGIAARLSSRTRRAPPMALAAAIAMAAAGLASFFTWAVLESRTVPPRHSDRGRDQFIRGAARSEIRTGAGRGGKDVSRTAALLEPATRAKIEASLAVIQKAHEDIRKALAADPQSPVLEQLWESTWHDEFDLYDRVVQATQPTMTRI